MKSTKSNLQQVQATVPFWQRRLKTKPALLLIAILFIGNLLWFIAWLIPNDQPSSTGEDEVVAKVEGTEITKQQWVSQMELLYGEDTLKDMVNEEVMQQAAKKNNIEVTDAEIELELKLMRSMQDTNDTSLMTLDDKQLKAKIRSQLILEKVLAQDIIIEDADAKKYYEDNQSLYNIETSYRTSVIVVDTKDAAEEIAKELSKGSQFDVLARERSIQSTSASLGGDIGYIHAKQEGIDVAIVDAASKLKQKEVSEPVKLSNNTYAIVTVVDILDGQIFTYKDVETHIKRELAIEQIAGTVTPEMFWSEFDTTWFYGESK